MRITLLTPLFPPDTGTPARYVKELAERLSHNEIDLLLYGHLPEEVSGVSYHCIDKRNILPLRLFRFTKKLYSLSKKTDVILVQNGPSVELPALCISFITNIPIVLCVSDIRAHIKAKEHAIYRFIHTQLRKRSKKTIHLITTQETFTDSLPTPEPRPEILPFGDTTVSLEEYEISWQTHRKALLHILEHATK